MIYWHLFCSPRHSGFRSRPDLLLPSCLLLLLLASFFLRFILHRCAFHLWPCRVCTSSSEFSKSWIGRSYFEISFVFLNIPAFVAASNPAPSSEAISPQSQTLSVARYRLFVKASFWPKTPRGSASLFGSRKRLGPGCVLDRAQGTPSFRRGVEAVPPYVSTQSHKDTKNTQTHKPRQETRQPAPCPELVDSQGLRPSRGLG
jgi:hypothetical protein